MNLKKLLVWTSATLISFSPVLAVIACNKPLERTDATLPKTLEETAYAIFKDSLSKENNIDGKTIFDKYKDQILGTYAINIIKEIMVRNEFAKIENTLKDKTKDITLQEYNNAQEKFNVLWDQLATEVLYQEYLKERVAGRIFETNINKDFQINQSLDWHINGTPKDDGFSTWVGTVQPEVKTLMTMTTQDNAITKFKTDLKERFNEYYTTSIKPRLLDSLIKITWLKDRMFRKEENGFYSINRNWEFPRATQTWDDNTIWKTKIKMVWEMKVKTADKSNLPAADEARKTPTSNNLELIEKFNSDINRVETSLDPIFNMAGFRGFATYNNADEATTYGNNSMEEKYKNAVFRTNIPGLAKDNPEIFDYYFGEKTQFQSRVYVLPIYLIDILKGYKVNEKVVDLTKDDLTGKWSSRENSARNNAAITDLSQTEKDKLLNQLLYVISENNNVVSIEQISKDLYNSYVKDGKNVVDKIIWSKISNYFKS